MSNAQPGWYPDPNARGRMRWWDGVRWHHATRTEDEIAQARLDADARPDDTGGAAPADPRGGRHAAAPRPAAAPASTPDATTQAIPLAPVLPSLVVAARESGTDAALTPEAAGPGGTGPGGPGKPGRRRGKGWWWGWGAGAAGVVVVACAAVALPGHDGDPAAAPSPTPSFVTLDPSDRTPAASSATATTTAPTTANPTPTTTPRATPTPTPPPTPTRTTPPTPRPTRTATSPSPRPSAKPTAPSTAPGTPPTTPTPTPTEQAPTGKQTCPEGAPVKGWRHTAFSPDSWSYDRVRPEACFTTVDAAKANGYYLSGL